MRAFYACLRGRAILVLVAVCAAVMTVPAQGHAGTSAARICVIVPHFKDEYWLSVGFGLHEAADRSGARLITFESGGYHSLERQIALLATCLAAGADGILIGAVSADDPQLTGAVALAAESVPVLALVNALDAPGLSGSVGVDWHGMGQAVGQYLAARHPDARAPARAVLVTGPEESGWGPILDAGLADGLSKGAVEIVATYRADTGLREQLREVERAFSEHPDVDYLIGSAPAVEGAMALFRRLPEGAVRPKLIATYVSHSVLRGLKRGQVQMVAFDDPIAQGRLGLELVLRSISGETFPGLSGPRILSVEAGDAAVDEIRLSPSGFFPELE